MIAAVLGLVVWLTHRHVGADASVYRAGALTLLKGEPLYTSADLTTLPDWVRLPFTYTPAAAALFLPLALVPAGLEWGVLTVLSVVSLTVVIAVVARPSRWWLLGATGAALVLEPVWKTLSLGQVNLILMAFVIVDVLVLSARNSRWAGVLIGVAAAVKLTPLIFVPYLFFTGRWKDGLRALGTFVALEAVMFAVIPHDAWLFWTKAATDPSRVGSVTWIFNQSLNGLVNRASALAPWSLTVAVGVGVVLAGPAVWLVVRYSRRGEPLAALLVAAFYALLLSPVSWSHHWVWAVPLIGLLVVTGRRWWALAAAALFASQIVMLVPNGGDVEFTWGLGWSILGNAYVVAAACGIVGLAVRELRLSAPVATLAK
ncbi:glycosyltransferase 87 family protein [Amycolatopsis rhabdoformis]|uniref:Glycosyltransferase 87 family protein n=1 Tax=Amycolatopsis rhabdoformis TaxID=1448059 RepID=A0ABZ1I7B2_9PSEU|nr:glycosyltransferase 87 family protein [Amycolatopsis rhabdoformis]WSE29404.1 glycosyltransferase 87 family protein [Amycolatopsis rhabdoformis]